MYEPFDFEKEFGRTKWEAVAGETRAPALHYQALLALKRKAGRAKDLMDIKALKKLDPSR